jgi:hypothetical protein
MAIIRAGERPASWVKRDVISISCLLKRQLIKNITCSNQIGARIYYNIYKYLTTLKHCPFNAQLVPSTPWLLNRDKRPTTVAALHTANTANGYKGTIHKPLAPIG